MFYDEAGRELSPGKVSRLHANLKNPKILTEYEAQQFVDNSALQQRVINQARAAGHDGVIALSVLEGIGERYRGDVYAVFDKSAMSLAKRPKAK